MRADQELTHTVNETNLERLAHPETVFSDGNVAAVMAAPAATFDVRTPAADVDA